MKGTTFLKPLEYNIEVNGEKWHQGDKVTGTLTVKNHSADQIVLPRLTLSLAEGNYKKIKAKDVKAWKLLHEMNLGQAVSLSANEQKNFSYEFSLKEDCLITDKNGSLYLTFNDKDEALPAGHIELVIEPKKAIKEILTLIENFLRFKIKEMKYVKGMVELKLIPPASRELSMIDSLILTMKEADNTLQMNFLFNVRGLDMTGGNLEAQKKTKEMNLCFTSKQYLIYGQSLNQDFLLESMNKVLADVKPKLL